VWRVTTIDVAYSAKAVLGEGPTWNPETRRLLWVDILNSEVHEFDPATGEDTIMPTPQHVSAVKPREGGGIAVNLAEGIGMYGPAGEFGWLARWPDPACRGNDAGVDPWGNLWAGTMRYDEAAGGGHLRRITPDGTVDIVVPNTSISNGLGWSPDERAMYFIDTPTRRVDRFDVDPDDGSVRNRRPHVTLPDDTPGSPDGMTVDADGCVWVALWDGWAVHRYTPDGKLDRVLEMPVARATACMFGGPEMRDLYISTARDRLSEAELEAQPLAGSLLVVHDVGQGMAMKAFAG
jgi:sugar lactone lactonase YvrE